MKTNLVRILSILLSVFLAGVATLHAEKKEKKPRRTVAHSVVSPLFERERQEDGSWKPVTYAIGFGQLLDPTERDESLTALSQDEMVNIIAKALYNENYLPETDPEKTDLVIVVNWGKTIPHNDGLSSLSVDGISGAINAISSVNAAIEASGGPPTAAQNAELDAANSELEMMLSMQSMADQARRRANDYNARLLGFAPELQDYYQRGLVGSLQQSMFDDLVEEIESTRYFVVLVAYDYNKLMNQREKSIQWITRFSIRAKGRKFDEELANMANAASSLFGVRSGRLSRNLLPGKGKLGELEVVDVIEDDEEEPSSSEE